MGNKFTLILLPVSLVVFVISLFAMVTQAILGDSEQVATIIGGSLGMLGGIIGAIGAYVAAKTQIDFQFKQLEIENKKKARPFIVCNDLRASYNLAEVDLNRDSKIIEFDYYTELKNLSKINSDGKIGFFQLKFLGAPDVIIECELKLYLDEDYYKKSLYEAYLDHMKNDVEVFIPIPFVTEPLVDDGKPKKLEIRYSTTEQEKFLYIYGFETRSEHLYLLEESGQVLVKEREFVETSWILPGMKKNK